MANTTTASELVVTKFLSDFFREYVRNSRFAPYTGTSSNNIITIKEGRKKIEVPLVTRLKNDGVTGSSTLRGNGEKVGNYGLTLTPTYHRHAVEFDREELEKPNIDLMRAARPLLMDWAMELQRDDIIEALGSIYNGTTYANYGDATDAAMNTWLTNNSDRILYGEDKSNQSAGDHSASLGNMDTDDGMDAAMTSVAKRMAQTADPHIRPIRSREDDEFYIMFHDPYAFRNLRTDLDTEHQNAMPRDKSNPLWKGGDLFYDNIIHREVPEIADFVDNQWGADATANGLNTAGSGSVRIGVSFLCGQQAVSYGLGQRPRIVVDRLYDYEFQPGVAVELKHDIDKSFFNNVQHGVVTVFSYAALDS